MDDGSGFTMGDEPPPETPEETVARLATLNPLEYDQVRLGEAKRLGVRIGTLDKAVAKARGKAGTASGRAMVALLDHDPWPDPVATGGLLDELTAAIRRHLILPTVADVVIALWIVHTWVHERFDHTPRLGITSPTKRCGKSTLLDVLRLTCRRTLKADNISAAGVFRTVEILAPLTLLIDEADSFLTDNEEIRGVLNSGYEKSGQVIRVVEIEGEHQPVPFPTFAPCALAAIGALPGTLADRAVPIRLERKPATDVVTKLRDGRSRAALADIGRKLARWTADHGPALSTDPAIPAAMGDREGDISVPLLAIADHAGPEWAKRARTALVELFGLQAAAEGTAETAVLLLIDLKAIFGDAEVKSSKSLCEALADMETRPWPEWKSGKPITPTQLARVLKPFGVRPVKDRPPGGEVGADGYPKPVQGYRKDDFSKVWQRYLSPTAAPGVSNPEQRNNVDHNARFAEDEAGTGGGVFRTDLGENCSHKQQCSAVPAQTAPGRPEGGIPPDQANPTGELEGEL